MMYMDFVRNPEKPEFQDATIQNFRSMDPSDTYANADLEKAFRKLADPIFNAKTVPATFIPTQVGNSYCASLYSSLLSLLSKTPSDQLLGKRIILFSYGSGLASSMFSVRVQKPVDDIVNKANILEKLSQRTAVSVEDYLKAMKLRESSFNQRSYTPKTSPDVLTPGTYYLTGVSSEYHRTYALKL